MSNHTASAIDINVVLRACTQRFTDILGPAISFRMSLSSTPLMIQIVPGDLERMAFFFAASAKAQPDATKSFAVETATVALDDAAAEAAELPAGAYGAVKITMPSDTFESESLDAIFDTCASGEYGDLDLFTACMTAKMWFGAIQCENLADDSTVYTILLPLAAETAPVAQPAPAYVNPLVSVLVVDDEPMLRALLRHMLTLDGFRVIEAEDAHQAIAILEQESDISLMLSDVVMPDMNGCELGAKVSKIRPSMPILYISGYMDDVAWRNEFEFTSHFLQKPFSQAELTKKVREILGVNTPEARHALAEALQ